jgi:hypothetical protein
VFLTGPLFGVAHSRPPCASMIDRLTAQVHHFADALG